MNPSMVSDEILRFGIFEVDLRSGELRKNGAKVKIQELPFRALKVLLSRPNEVVSREDLRRALWPEDVFVDFDHGISSAINRLRDALGDSAENPIFVETVERRGYRWIAPVQPVQPPLQTSKLTVTEMAAPLASISEDAPSANNSRPVLTWVLPILAIAILAWVLRPVTPRANADAARTSVSVSAPASVHHPSNPEAEDFYLKGRFYWNKRTPEGLTKAVDLFTQAIVHDPGYAKAYVGLADCYNLLREYTLMPASEAYPRALAAAKKAVELDDQSSEAHTSLAFASFWGMWDAATADREFRRAIELDPKNAIAHHWYATYLITVGRPSEALAEIDQARALDPSSAAILADKGDILMSAGQMDEGMKLLKQMEATDPSFISPHRYLKRAYLEHGDGVNYVAEAKQEATLMKDPVGMAIANAAQRGFDTSGFEGMLKGVRAIETKYYAEDKLSPYELAEVCARMGDREEALRYLQASLEKHDQDMPSLPTDSAFQSLQGEPQFQAILARARTPLPN